MVLDRVLEQRQEACLERGKEVDRWVVSVIRRSVHASLKKLIAASVRQCVQFWRIPAHHTAWRLHALPPASPPPGKLPAPRRSVLAQPGVVQLRRPLLKGPLRYCLRGQSFISSKYGHITQCDTLKNNPKEELNSELFEFPCWQHTSRPEPSGGGGAARVNPKLSYLVQVQGLGFPGTHDVIHGEREETDLSQVSRLTLLPLSHPVQLMVGQAATAT